MDKDREMEIVKNVSIEQMRLLNKNSHNQDEAYLTACTSISIFIHLLLTIVYEEDIPRILAQCIKTAKKSKNEEEKFRKENGIEK